ncbi:MAG TPA: hypothetical protein VH414_14355 [Lichenihabitans sp.]|nr:hypothetical protein [Lichenihabitans sp.]
MSNITEIRQAYERLRDLLDQEILNRRSEAKELQRFRKWLDTAFYLLGWASFENLTRKQAETVVSAGARSKGKDSHAWIYLKESFRRFPVKSRLELIFHRNPRLISSLKNQYDVRNDAAHDYKKLPPEVNDLPSLLQEWEDLVTKF